MRPLVVFGDAQAAAATRLRTALAARTEDYAAGASVGSRVPGDRSTDTPKLPYVLVAVDDDQPDYPVNTLVVIRISVWHRDSDAAFDLAQLCRGLLLVHSGPVIRNVRRNGGTGPVRGTDPDTGVDLATFTVEANIRPTRLEA